MDRCIQARPAAGRVKRLAIMVAFSLFAFCGIATAVFGFLLTTSQSADAAVSRILPEIFSDSDAVRFADAGIVSVQSNTPTSPFSTNFRDARDRFGAYQSHRLVDWRVTVGADRFSRVATLVYEVQCQRGRIVVNIHAETQANTWRITDIRWAPR